MVEVYNRPEWIPRFLNIYEALMFYQHDKNTETLKYGRYYNDYVPALREIDAQITNIAKRLNGDLNAP